MSFAMTRSLPTSYTGPESHRSEQSISKTTSPTYPFTASQETIKQYLDHAKILKDLSIEQIAANIRSKYTSTIGGQSEITFAAAWLLRFCEECSDSEQLDAARMYSLYCSSCSVAGVPVLTEASFEYLTPQVLKTLPKSVQGRLVYPGVRLRSELLISRGDSHVADRAIPRNDLIGPRNQDLQTSQGLPKFQQPLELEFQNILVSPGFSLIQFGEKYPEGYDQLFVDTTRKKYFDYCQRLIQSFGSLNLKEFTCFLQMIRDQLPSPMFEILNSPELVDWVRETDFSMYKEMLRLLSPLVLREIPPRVVAGLCTLSKTIVREAMELISDSALHFYNAKIEPVQTFARLLDRFLRVNETARNAANFLSDRDSRQLILNDLRSIDLFGLVSRTSLCQQQDVYNVLTEDIFVLLNLEPQENGMSSPTPSSHQFYRDSSLSENVLEAWARYFSELPRRFHSVDARYFVLCLGQIGDSVIREITRNEGPSFSALWVIKCWIDEWVVWNGERNAFLLDKH